jgi:hypothetical protein
MTPRLQILISSGPKKGTQIYFSFLSKRPGKTNPIQVPQRGLYRERCPITGYFYIYLDISFYLKGPKKERPSMFHKRGAPIKTDKISEPYLTYFSGSTVKQSFPEALQTETRETEREREGERESENLNP